MPSIPRGDGGGSGGEGDSMTTASASSIDGGDGHGDFMSTSEASAGPSSSTSSTDAVMIGPPEFLSWWRTGDLVSRLPDGVLCHILSFVPTLDAARTAVLSKRWRHLFSTLIDFDFQFPREQQTEGRKRKRACGFRDFVTAALALHPHPKIRRLSLSAPSYYISDLRPQLDMWVHAAVRKQVEEVVLNLEMLEPLSVWEKDAYTVPHCLTDCLSLTRLELSCCKFRSKRPIFCGYLRFLSLQEVFLSEDLLTEVAAGCPVLDSLVVRKCHGVRGQVVLFLNLKHLIVEDSCFSVDVSAPRLLSVVISGPIRKCKHSVKEAWSLISVTLDLQCSAKGVVDAMSSEYVTQFSDLLEDVRLAKSLTLSGCSVLMFFMHHIRNAPLPVISCREIKLTIALQKWELLGIFALLKCSPGLETLILKINTVEEKQHDILFPGASDVASKIPESSYLEDHLSTLPYAMQHLKNIEVHAFSTKTNQGSYTVQYHDNLLHLVEILLKNANGLENIFFYPPNNQESKGGECKAGMTFENILAFIRATYTNVHVL